MKAGFKTVLMPALAVLLAVQAVFALGAERRYSDAHLHYVDFFQNTQGIEALLAAMDKAGVEHVALMGMPMVKMWHEDEPRQPRYFLGDDAPMYWYSATDAILAEAVKRLPEAQRRRVHPFLSGFNPTDKNAPQHIERMLELYPGLWQGIGEVITRHDHLSALMQGEVPRADSEAMMRVYRTAAKHDLPVLLHSNITSLREKDLIYLEELERALEKHPQTRFIWAHAGTSAAINQWQEKLPGLVPTLDRLLRQYDNLWIDLSWSVLEPHILDAKGKPRRAWLDLLQRHPDRFMLGSDLVGDFDKLEKVLNRFTPLLEALPPATAQKLAHDNFLGVLPGAGMGNGE